MPHDRLNAHKVYAGGRQEGAVGVSQVVEPQRPKPDRVASSLEASSECGAVERPAERVAEQPILWRGVVFSPAETIECRRRLIRKRDTADSATLGRRLNAVQQAFLDEVLAQDVTRP